jgi:simple sugar transport system substrate-binding protein
MDAQDACAITGTSYSWVGSTDSVVSEMVSAFTTAIASKAAGIGCPLIDNTAFNGPTDTALNAGIPVIAYNADVSAGVVNNRLCYIGQNNLTAGAAVGKAILAQGIGKGDLVAGIIATPGDREHPAPARRREAHPHQGRRRFRGGRDFGDRGLA